MRRNNKKKGFTIVELVIVIAVIAILAAVMIPTFSGVIENAKEAAVIQEANAMYKNYLAGLNYETETAAENLIFNVDGKYVVATDGEIKEKVYATKEAAQADYTAAYTFTVVNYSTANDAAADAVATEANTVDGTKPTEASNNPG